MTNAVFVKNADRMMTTAGLTEHGLELRFADGLGGTIPLADIPEVSGPKAFTGLELPNPYEVVLTTANGERVEIPWDFARHYCDATYRPIIEAIAMQGRGTLGGRIRQLREAAGLTQAALADAADIGRVTLVRLEKGGQSPTFKTLDAIATALGIAVPDLLVESGSFIQWPARSFDAVQMEKPAPLRPSMSLADSANKNRSGASRSTRDRTVVRIFELAVDLSSALGRKRCRT